MSIAWYLECVERNIQGFNLPTCMAKLMRTYSKKEMFSYLPKNNNIPTERPNTAGFVIPCLRPSGGGKSNSYLRRKDKKLVGEHVMFKSMSPDCIYRVLGF